MKSKILGLVLLGMILIGPPEASANFQCGIRPIAPIGCGGGYAECLCFTRDDGTTECRWVWRCSRGSL